MKIRLIVLTLMYKQYITCLFNLFLSEQLTVNKCTNTEILMYCIHRPTVQLFSFLLNTHVAHSFGISFGTPFGTPLHPWFTPLGSKDN